MKKVYVIIGLILIVGVIGLIKLFNPSSSVALKSGNSSSTPEDLGSAGAAMSSSSGTNQQTNSPQASAGGAQLMQSTGVLFANSPDYASAYRIFPTFVSAAAKTALDGFDMQVSDLGNNIFKVSLIAKAKNYQTQTFIVKGTQKVYFVEKSIGDDTPNQDYIHTDDYGVAVDENGYILK